jgi:hypothetical protein
MSYSFSAKADSKDAAIVQVEEQLELVVSNQPIHAADRQVARDAAEAFINVLADPSVGEAVYVSINGSVSSWITTDAETGERTARLSAASVGVHASIGNA